MIQNGCNPEKIKYFELRDFLANIQLNSRILEHIEETSQALDRYMERLAEFKQDDVIHYWLFDNFDEIVDSNLIENHPIDRKGILEKELYVKDKELTHKKIHELHRFAMQDKKVKKEGYRDTEVRVSALEEDGTEKIFWYGVEPEDVQKFMDAFLKIYSAKSMSIIDTNPIVKSAIIHLLFLRIHPYKDGNGRTSRILHSKKFTESINHVYGRKLKLCPLNISRSILINKPTYVNIMDNLYFDTEHDNTKYINKWIEFILNMIDEQLYFRESHMSNLESAQKKYDSKDEQFLLSLKNLIPNNKDSK